ncbi:MAG: hypothetical protein P8127_06780, partial [Acidobacteriota bacterium]
FRDPVDLFSTGCTAWTAQSSCLGAPDNDICFSLEGSVGGDLIFVDGFEKGDTTAWSSAVP